MNEQPTPRRTRNLVPRFRKSSRILTIVMICSAIMNACMEKKKTFADINSQTDAISAASKNMFGTNVRGYMWALTSANPQDVKPPAPSNSQPNVFGAGFQLPDFSKLNPLAQKAEGNKTDDVVKNYYQCWYYAETPFYVKLDGPQLKKLFGDKKRTKNVNHKFVDIQNLYSEQQKNANLRKMISFGASALQVGLCGTAMLLAKKGSAHFERNQVLFPAICSMGMISINNAITQFSGGDATWGSDKAKEQIEKQIRSKIDQLDEINWDALMAIKSSAKGFDAPDKQKLNTPYNCPSNDGWVAELMTDDSKPAATPAPTATPSP